MVFKDRQGQLIGDVEITGVDGEEPHIPRQFDDEQQDINLDKSNEIKNLEQEQDEETHEVQIQ